MKATRALTESSHARFGRWPSSARFLRLRNYTIEYNEMGEGDPLILVPGMAGGMALLAPLARALAPRFRVISYQLRGETDCFSLRRPFALDDLAEDLREFLDALRLESPTVCGVSFGGVIALHFAARFGQRLGRLVVQGVGSHYENGLIQQAASTILSRFPLPADSPFVNQFFNLLFGARLRNRALADFVIRQVWQTDQSLMAHRFGLVEAFDMESKLSAIRVPTLVMAADRDVLVSVRALAPLCDRIADVRFARLPRCGHLAFVTQPELLAGKIGEFVTT